MLKDLVDTLSQNDMCKYCLLTDECSHLTVEPAPNGEPIFSACTDRDNFIKNYFDIDAYIAGNLDGLVLCRLCKNRPECEEKISKCKDIDKLTLPCGGGKLEKDWFEEDVFKSLILHMGSIKESMSIEIVKNKDTKKKGGSTNDI